LTFATLLLGCAIAGHGEHLPMRRFTTADGLARDSVHCIAPDKDGFLWFCTGEGISRFDGYGFKTYGVTDGLPDRDVRSLIQARDGTFWVATGCGLSRFEPNAREGQKRFVNYPLPDEEADRKVDSVNVLLEDHTGAIWIGTDRGLFGGRLDPGSRSWTIRGLDLAPEPGATQPRISSLSKDGAGRIWIGTSSGLFVLSNRSANNGGIRRYGRRDGLAGDFISVLLHDPDGSLWIGTHKGLSRARFETSTNRLEVERTFTTKDGLPEQVGSLLRASDGALWVGGLTGLARSIPGANPSQFKRYGAASGLIDGDIQGLAEDGDGNIWIGADGGGTARIARDGLTGYDEPDGLPHMRVGSMTLDREGRLLVAMSAPGTLMVYRFRDGRFSPIHLAVLPEFYPPAWLPWHQTLLVARRGDWWVASSKGLLQFRPPPERDGAEVAPQRIFRARNGLPGDGVDHVFADSADDIWLSTVSAVASPFPGERTGLAVLSRKGGIIRRFSESDGLPSLSSFSFLAIYQDHVGQIWVGLHRSGIARFRGGKFEVFTRKDGVPDGGVRVFYEDHLGHLWLGSGRGGLGEIQDPCAERLSIKSYTTANGLASDEIQALTEDNWGRIYVGTGFGVDRLNVSTGSVRHYTSADGLAEGEVEDAIRDGSGDLWFGTLKGVSRLTPRPDGPALPIRVRIAGVRVAGQLQDLGGGEVRPVALPDIPASQNHVEIDFAGMVMSGSEDVLYQYRLEGAETDWSAPRKHRTVVYSNLRPGSYRFLARGLGPGRMPSKEPAVVTFRILPHLWERWWFLSALAMSVTGIVYLAYRYRVAYVLEMERMRTRIACDLHDDVGSALSKIAILSEVALLSVATEPVAGATLERIAETSREALDGVGDLVWAINARTESLEDLVRRMRSFAAQLFEAKDVRFQFEASDLPLDRHLGPETLRQLYLIFKEAANNAARHSQCTEASARLWLDRGMLVMEVKDNGKGFQLAPDSHQHGIASLKARAASLRGHIQWRFEAGTAVVLTIPLPK
jgi:ligand-binding sensor domain-containing protein